MGIDLPLQVGRSQTFVSEVHKPIGYVLKFAKLRPRTVPSQRIGRLLRDEHLRAVGYAMADPNLAAVFQDFQKYSYSPVEEVNLPRTAVQWVIGTIVDMLSPALVGADLSPWSVPYAMEHMAKNTSPGHPWTSAFKDKRAWCNAGLDYDAILTFLFATKLCFWNVSFKEEIRPLEKLKANKARSFMSGPVEENLACLVIFGALLSQIVDDWRTLPITYGINPRRRGWDFLVRRFRGKRCFAIDFSRFDGSLVRFLFWVTCEILKKLVPDGPTPWGCSVHEAITSIILMQVSGPCVFSNGMVVQKENGNPSGSGLTIFVNCVIQLILVLLYLHICHQVDELDLEQFELQVHGDDGRHGASEDFIGCLNFDDMNAFYRSIGWPVEVTSDFTDAKPPEDLVFLSHKTVSWNNVFVPVPEDPLKLIASAELRNADALPEDVDEDAYLLARLVQITNELVFCEEFDAMERVCLRFIREVEAERPSIKNDVSWAAAKRHIKQKHVLVSSYVDLDPLVLEQTKMVDQLDVRCVRDAQRISRVLKDAWSPCENSLGEYFTPESSYDVST